MKKIKNIFKKFFCHLLIFIFKLKFFTKCKFKKNNKSIVLVIHSFQLGGAEKQWIYLANSLTKKFDVTLVSLESKDTHYKYLLNSNIRYFSIDILDNPDLKIPFLLRGLNKFFFNNFINENIRNILPLHYLLKSIDPSLVVSQLDYNNSIVGIASVINAKKCILSFRSYAPYHFDFHDDRYLEIYNLFKKFSNIKYCGNSKLGNEDYAKWLKINKKNIFLLNNLNFNNPEPCTEVSKNKKFIIFGAFRFSSEKNPFLFIQIAEKLLKKNKNFIFQIAGNGPLYDDIKKYIQLNKLQKNIFLLGNRSNINSLIRSSDILLSTSFYEGSSNIIIEALFSGLYVVASNTGANKEMIYSKQYGCVISGYDIQPYVDSIMKHYKHNIRKKFTYKAKFSNEDVMKQFNSILKSY